MPKVPWKPLPAAALAIFLLALVILFVTKSRLPLFPVRDAVPADRAVRAANSPSPDKETTGADWKSRLAKARPGDYPGLMRELLGLRDPALRADLAKLLVRAWVTADLPGFIAFVDAAEVDDAADAGSLWALLAPALAGSLPTLSEDVASRPELREVVRRLIEYSARKDPDQALAWARQWLMDDPLESALATIAGEMIKQDPEKALDVLRQIQTSVRRVDAIAAIAAVYGATDPREATDWARTLAIPAERPYAMNAVLAARAEIEPEASARDFADFRGKMAADYAVERQAEIARMGASDVRPHAPGDPLSPEEAMDSETLPSPEDPQLRILDDAARAIAESWGEAAPLAALRWSESLPPGLKNDVVESALAGWATRDPAAAYAYYMQNYPGNPAPAEPIFEAWAQAEPEAAAGQARQLTDAARREKAVAGVVSGWLDSPADPAALIAWVDTLPGKRERDAANLQIAEAASYAQPAAAWQRATAIQDSQSRREALRSAFASLVESDPDQARNLLASTPGLSRDETARLGKMLRAATVKN